MTFVFPALLGGLVLIGIPVLIHLIMRQKPKILQFPAFRFLVHKHRRNLTKLRLRHFLLLALRIFLIAAVCLALARPKLFSEALKIGGDRPVAAVFVIDTRPGMEYKVPRDNESPTRLEDAKRRALEMLDRLPAGSRVAVLETARAPQGGKGVWQTSTHQARKQIEELRIGYGRGSVTERLEDAYRLLNTLARSKDDDGGKNLARLVCVFSDRTKASWDGSRLPKLNEERDQLPPPFERLGPARETIPNIIAPLKELRQRIPPANQDYPVDEVIALLEKARDRLGDVSDEYYPQTELTQFVGALRARVRELLKAVEAQKDRVGADAKEYYADVTNRLRQFLQELRGAHEVYVDVGVDNPADGAVLDLEPPREGRQNVPRQEFATHEKFLVRATVSAGGKDLENVLVFQMGTRKEQQPVSVKAGDKRTVTFQVDCADLAAGPHQIQVSLANPDLMPFNNARYLTFQVREPRKILIIADEPEQASVFKSALDSLVHRGFRTTVETKKKVVTEGRPITGYAAVYLMNVEQPPDPLWELLAAYARKGGGVGVIPDPHADVEMYKSIPARNLLPATLGKNPEQVKLGGPGQWSWDSIAFQHPMMRPFADWKGNRGLDIVRFPAEATRFWPVQLPDKGEIVLVRYGSDKGPPALVARELASGGGRGGRVLLFTTTMDPRDPPWNDYYKSLSSFFLILADLSTTYLAGDTEPVQLNFLSGQEPPTVKLPLGQRFDRYTLWRGGEFVATVNAEREQNVMRFPQAVAPGSYGADAEGKRRAAFAVNVPADQCLLVRVPVEEVESLLGRGSVVAAGARANLQEAISGHWSQPVDLLPTLLLLALIALAVENLLANKFYRREPEPQS